MKIQIIVEKVIITIRKISYLSRVSFAADSGTPLDVRYQTETNKCVSILSTKKGHS